MKRGKTNAKRKPLAVAVEPVVGHFPDGFDPFAALYRVSLTSAVARDALEGKLPRTLQWSVTPSEYALFNICHALDDMAKALAYFNMPNPTGHAPARSAAEGR
jgi:hypothetical protein